MTQYPQLTTEILDGERKATLHTNYGDIDIKLFESLVPKTVENFITLAKDHYYDGIIFHRVIKDFMIQGGDPTGTGMGGESSFGGAFEDEFDDKLYNLYGALSMANAGPNTNGSQFFIVQAKMVPSQMLSQLEGAGFPAEIVKAYTEQGGTPWLDRRHSVFGHVINGMDIVEKIANVETKAQDKPVEDVVIESISID
ncbi:peptidylprolyl isomerase [Abyssicoccus albus]|uniref:Peptidyl-prolyl cis-trans isomerase n=1 Tax=Abyssicoccus albus TaxID=1817405 RepID=A0A3N5BIW8_9BACL|nr:peptidylprolyl isomerase [Abyssicoccus albus]RPF57577.1 peptidyl-prolyl cis-trans isomerase B (cyclophilin B) [Abyssicoccus albus]